VIGVVSKDVGVFVCLTGLVTGAEGVGGLIMRPAGAFTLFVEPATEVLPARVSITLTGAASDAHGVLHLTPDCMTLDELESCINGLQDELDVLRAEARRVFTSSTGHA
jgi:hypothetical protein